MIRERFIAMVFMENKKFYPSLPNRNEIFGIKEKKNPLYFSIFLSKINFSNLGERFSNVYDGHPQFSKPSMKKSSLIWDHWCFSRNVVNV